MWTRILRWRSRSCICGGLALITFCLYLPVWWHDFVNYDDQQYVTDNPRVQAGLTKAGLKWAFGFYAGNWHPLTWMSHMLDCALYGGWAGGHHLTSVLVHIATTLTLFMVLEQMTQTTWRSAAVAALFAWHPLHVESVAWVAERKDVLCAFFWMLTLLAYGKYAAGGEATPERGRRRSLYYGLALMLFTLALMAKPMAVTLPFILVLLDFWPLRRQGKWAGRISEKIPFLMLSVAACALTLHAQQTAIVSTAGLAIPQRLVHVLAAYGHYLAAMFVPLDLAVYYPYRIPSSGLAATGVGVGLTLVTIAAIAAVGRRPYLLAGWLWFLGTLVPVIGLVQVGDQAWADRYTYLPLIGPFIMVTWLAADAVKWRTLLAGISAAVAVALLTLTSVQLSYWQNTRTLFAHAEQVTKDNYLAITMLGSLLAEAHQYEAAIGYYQRALRLEPNFPEAHFFMGAALDEEGKLSAAISEYQLALWFKPTQEQTHIFMGMALAKEKRYEEAAHHYEAALKLNPDSAVAHNNLGRILHSEGKLEAATAHYRTALALNPKLALAHNNLGILLLEEGKVQEGTAQLREALSLAETNVETQFNLAVALNGQQQWREATNLFTKSINGREAGPKAHFEYAKALTHVGKIREAMGEYAQALLLQPDYPDALTALAWILSTNPDTRYRNGPEGLKMAAQAYELTNRREGEKLATLAAAYAECRQFAEATNAIMAAENSLRGANQTNLTVKCERMLEQFQQAKAWREQEGP